MTQVRPKLFIGSEYDARCYAALRDCGITAVLNVAEEVQILDRYSQLNIRYAKVGLRDEPAEPSWLIDAAAKALSSFLMGGETVLIHCALGLSRSPFVAAAALCVLEKRPWPKVWDDLRAKRPEILDVSNLALQEWPAA